MIHNKLGNQDSLSQSRNLTPDGGIVKIPLVAGTKSPSFSKGSNAKFNYYVHAYLVPSENNGSIIPEATAASHVHGPNCSHKHQGTTQADERKAKLESMKSLIDNLTSKSIFN